jgi:hypothetical protein
MHVSWHLLQLQITVDKKYKAVADSILAYVAHDMTHADGGFFRYILTYSMLIYIYITNIALLIYIEFFLS